MGIGREYLYFIVVQTRNIISDYYHFFENDIKDRFFFYPRII